VRKQLVTDAKVHLTFEVRRPPLESDSASRRLAAYGHAIYDELGMPMQIARSQPAAARRRVRCVADQGRGRRRLRL
jgi:hypothetical protein